MTRIYKALFVLILFSTIDSEARQYAPQFGAEVTVSGNEVFVAEGRNRIAEGSVFSYTVSNGVMKEGAVLTAEGAPDSPNGFGRALFATDSDLLIGAPLEGAVYAYSRGSDGAWIHQQRLGSNSEGFGSKIYVNGNRALIAESGGRESQGRVFVYVRDSSGEWSQETELGTSSAENVAGFGMSLYISDSFAIVGAPSSAAAAGAVFVFERSAGGQWSEGSPLVNPGVQSGFRFGTSLALVDGRLFVGSPGVNSGAGTVIVFENEESSGDWAYERRLSPFDSRGGEAFGTSIAQVGGRIWIGAPGYGKREGMVYELEIGSYSGRTQKIQLIQPASIQYRAGYGGKIAASDDAVIVGSVGFDNFEGAAFVYSIGSGGTHELPVLTNDSGVFASVTGGLVECEGEEAGDFQCRDIDMASFLTNADIGARRGIQVNDVWGWEDPETGKEYAIIGRTDGTSFVDLSDPYNPVYLGNLALTPTANQALHRDVKVYKHYALVVADGAGAHHMQIFDLRHLRNLDKIPAEFEPDALYKEIYSSHNLIVNEESGFVYAVGSDSGGESCGGALHMIDMADPLNPTFAGCFADSRTGRRGNGSTHDAQCVIYHGPDADYQGHEICLSSNGTAVSIADVTDKDNPIAISLGEYPNVAYTHQGWLSEDHKYFYLNDEGDEASGLVDKTRTLIFDVTDLDEPVVANEYYAKDSAIDHNLYVKGNLMYQTNYQAGLRILDISNPTEPVEVGYFDTVPYGENNSSGVLGAWSNYPFFKSGVIIVTSGREGVFFLKKKQIDT